LFDKYGDVGDIYIPTERGTGRSRGFAFVRYYDKRDAEVSLPHNKLKSSFLFSLFYFSSNQCHRAKALKADCFS
jgi:RNA recognition motif-containing protein